MVTQQKKPDSQVALSDRGDSTHTDTAERAVTIVPATSEIDLGIDPIAYRYESWSEMADEWVESLRSTAETMPDPDHDQIRNVTLLVPLSEAEALVEKLLIAREVNLPHKSTEPPEETSSL